MAETKTEVKTFKVEYVCDECGEETLKHEGGALLSSPPQYRHRCSNCGCSRTFLKIYPHIKHEYTLEQKLRSPIKNILRVFLNSIKEYENEHNIQISDDTRESEELVELFLESEDAFNFEDIVKILENEKTSLKHYDKNSCTAFTLSNCPGYEGYLPPNLSHEVCKHCGNIHYYH